jgi:hypothetical protein
MKQKFTQNHLVKYLYSETSASERLAIDEALATDITLQEQYRELLSAYQQLPKVSFSPSESAVSNVLAYSKRTALERQA